jgi:hypothetical protein
MFHKSLYKWKDCPREPREDELRRDAGCNLNGPIVVQAPQLVRRLEEMGNPAASFTYEGKFTLIKGAVDIRTYGKCVCRIVSNNVARDIMSRVVPPHAVLPEPVKFVSWAEMCALDVIAVLGDSTISVTG